MHRRMSEQSFVEAFLPDRVGRNEKLERIDQVVDWKKLAKLVNGIYASPSGRPSYPPVVMVKTMVLQRWFPASDDATAEALWYRPSVHASSKDSASRTTFPTTRRSAGSASE